MWKFKEPKNPALGQYWISDPIPQNTEQYKFLQSGKNYKKGNAIVNHPGWIYDNGALVDDDYLFYNEGYKLVIDIPPTFDAKTHACDKNAIHLWDETEKTITITYTVREKTEVEINQDISLEWENVKKIRSSKLSKLDSAVFIAIENNLTLSQTFKDYRQQLRDITETYTDPYFVVWPAEPDPFTYYE